MSIRGRLRRRVGAMLAPWTRGPTSGRILLYHRIDELAHPSLSVPPRLFRSHVAWLEDLALRGRSVRTCRDEGFAPGTIAISFDDGDASVVPACAELSERGWAATLFISPDLIGRGRTLSWTDLRDLSSAGHEVALHGKDHTVLARRPLSSILVELREARQQLEDQLGSMVEGLAYPFGVAPSAARIAAGEAGLSYACTTLPGRNDARTEQFRLHRNEVLSTDRTAASFAAKIRGTDDWMATVRALELVARYGP